MFTVWGPQRTTCDGLSRRNFLKVGSLMAGGLTLADLLRFKAQGGLADSAASMAAILVFLPGGPSHHETYDPKPLAPAEVRGPFGTINTNVPGTILSETLPHHARLADKYTLIRSCHHDNSGHGGGQRYVMTGYKSASLEDELPHDYPSVGAIAAKVKGANRVGMPASVNIPPSGRGGAAFLGAAYDPFQLYSNGRMRGVELTPNVYLKGTRLNDRLQLRQSLDNLRREIDSSGMMKSMDALEQQAFEIVSAGVASAALDVKQESQETRDLYGDHDFGRSCLLARRLVETGVGFVTISMGSWDHHGNAGGSVKVGLEKNGPPMDQAVSALIEDLYRRGLDRQVTVFVWGEFGRTPRVNKEGGRDHWPQAMSVLMAGGGMKMGQIIGATDRKGERPQDRPLIPGDVLATVYHNLGIDRHQQFLNSAGRPISILTDGKPIAELIG